MVVPGVVGAVAGAEPVRSALAICCWVLLLGLLAPLLMAPLRPLPIRIRRPGVIIRLFFLVGRDVIVSNLQVGLGCADMRLAATAFALHQDPPGLA